WGSPAAHQGCGYPPVLSSLLRPIAPPPNRPAAIATTIRNDFCAIKYTLKVYRYDSVGPDLLRQEADKAFIIRDLFEACKGLIGVLGIKRLITIILHFQTLTRPLPVSNEPDTRRFYALRREPAGLWQVFS